MPAYLDALLRYFEFSGRSTRRQYWSYGFMVGVVYAVASVIDAVVGTSPEPHRPGFFVVFVGIFHVVPSLTVAVRRLHDVGRSGWWYLLTFIPIANLFLFYWLGFQKSEPGSNDYGDAEGQPLRRAGALDYERALRRPAAAPASSLAVDSPQRFI
ncbi:MAG TPA: DUF805 domain-containing protein [Devosia sp.]|jgi:uncharacterized membrane protein YhaH (DUF805 family)|nr:DUF805 domain-containing protein [Devosia sp.]